MSIDSTMELWQHRRLYEVINWSPNQTDLNLFYVLRNTYHAPWDDSLMSSPFDTSLFNAYFGMRSNNKITSPMVDYLKRYYNIADIFLNREAIRALAQMLWNMYGNRWTRMWDVYQYEYNPGENYDMIERMTDDTTVDQYGKTVTRTDNLQHSRNATQTDNLQHTKTGTETTTPDITETTTPDLETSESSKIFGFDSAAGSDSDSSITSATGTSTLERTGTETLQHNTIDADTGTRQTTEGGSDTGTQTHAETGSDTHTRNYQLTRSGNIGVTTTQQMLQSDIDLWVWNYFEDVVFPDIDKVLTIAIY